MGVMFDHKARAFGAAARAFRRSAGTLGSSTSGASSSVTTSPACAPADSLSFRLTLSQWLFWPSGSSVARKGKPLMVPSTVVMPREGSFALASFGRIRKVQEPSFSVAAGRRRLALKRILAVVLVIFVSTNRNLLLIRCAVHSRRASELQYELTARWQHVEAHYLVSELGGVRVRLRIKCAQAQLT